MSEQKSQPRFADGETVFLVITPATTRLYMDYRPKYPYFVLQTSVSKVRELGPGFGYEIETRYYVRRDRIFKERAAAEEAMPGCYEEDTKQSFPAAMAIPFLTREEEEAYEDAWTTSIRDRLARSSPPMGYD